MAVDSSSSVSSGGRQSIQERGGVNTTSTMNGVGRPNGNPSSRANATGRVRAGRRSGLSARS